MEVEILHAVKGDKKKNVDTSTPEGRGQADALLRMLSEEKCAVFLERGRKTYRVVGYDAQADKLVVDAGKKKTKLVTTKGYKVRCGETQAKVTAVAPVAGGATPYQLALEKAFNVRCWSRP